MSDTFSGRQVVGALKRIGFIVYRQRGSHVFLHNPTTGKSTTVPRHRELRKGTLHGILAQAGITRKRLKELL